MGKIFLIADSHFGAKEVIRVFKRPFKTVREMDRVMEENWNRAVEQNDTVISAGDFTWDPERRQKLLRELHGNKILIRGNHDCGGPEAGADYMVGRYVVEGIRSNGSLRYAIDEHIPNAVARIRDDGQSLTPSAIDGYCSQRGHGPATPRRGGDGISRFRRWRS